MKAVYEVKENSTAELVVTVDGEQWSKALDKAFKKIAATVELKGFRKGKAPESMVKKVVSDKQVEYEAVDLVAQEALTYGLDENKEVVLEDRPQLDVESTSQSEAVLKFILTVKPEVKLGDYKSVEYKVEKEEITEEKVNEQVETLRNQHSEEILKEEGTIENGNIAVIDFEGFVDGVAFDGGKGTEYPLEIGSHSFIEGFEEQLIGMATDEEKDINVTFPENYAAELAGKPATFHVKVDGIKVKQLPELNDEFVAELEMGEEVKTVEDLKNHVKEDLQKNADAKAEREAEDAYLTKLIEVCPVEVPEVMINRKVEDLYEEQSYSMTQNGISMDTFLQITGQKVEDYKERIKPQAEERIKVELILEAIGKDMKIEVTDEDIENEYSKVAESYGMEVDKVKQLVNKEYLSEGLVINKTLEALKNPKAE